MNELDFLRNFTDQAISHEQFLFNILITALVSAAIAIFYVRIGNRYTDETRKTEFFTGATKYAQKALNIKPLSAEANYIMALAISNLSTTGDAKARIASTTEIKKYLDIALKSNPKHAGAWYLLGRWHYRVANFNMAEVTAANIFLGGVPEGATNELAIEAMKNAIQYNSHNLIFYYDLARIYKETKDEDNCMEILNKAVCIAPATSEDLEISRRCKLMMTQVERYALRN